MVEQPAKLVDRQLHATWDRHTLQSALTAFAVAKGHFDIAEALANLNDHIIRKIIDDEID